MLFFLVSFLNYRCPRWYLQGSLIFWAGCNIVSRNNISCPLFYSTFQHLTVVWIVAKLNYMYCVCTICSLLHLLFSSVWECNVLVLIAVCFFLQVCWCNQLFGESTACKTSSTISWPLLSITCRHGCFRWRFKSGAYPSELATSFPFICLIQVHCKID